MSKEVAMAKFGVLTPNLNEDYRKSRKKSPVRTGGLWIKIWSRDFRNMNHEG